MTAADLKGVILAAGKGTRMQPFSEHYPKPILPLGGKPLISHQLEILAQIGIRDVTIVIGHLGQEVVNALGDGSRYGLKIEYVVQEETLGIAHAVSGLERFVDRPFFLLLGDIYFETDKLDSMIEQFRGSADGVLAVKRESDPAAIRRNFVVITDADKRVTRVIEKPRHPRTNLKGCGIYLFDLAFFDAVRRTPRTALRNEYEITDSIQIFIEDGYRVEAAEVVMEDLNLSFPKDLLDLNLHYLERKGHENLLGKNVKLADGSRVKRSVLMDGVEIDRPVTIEDCLIFPGVKLSPEQDLRRRIVTMETEINCD
ncbi:MAG: sugar phosphate nucleotidyltransferase [Planctomycetota bacterium]|jgi:dTDP-glucose pyrophosphorylase